MLIVQYPMQFNGHPRNISNPCSAQLCAGERWSTNTTWAHVLHALLLLSKHLNLLHGRRPKHIFLTRLGTEPM